MNSDGINRINFLRDMYQSKEVGSATQEVRELQLIKNELKISNDEKTRDNNQITNATNSPYLADQLSYKKDVVYNSTEETSWRDVKTVEQIQKEAQELFLQKNRRRLNII